MLRRWFVEDKGETYAYQWEENESVVDWMETQKQNDGSTVIRNINAVKKDAIISQIRMSLEVNLVQQFNEFLFTRMLFRNVLRLLWMLLLVCAKLCYQASEEKLSAHLHNWSLRIIQGIKCLFKIFFNNEF